MSSNTNPLLVQNRAQLVAQHQARQARRRQRNQLAQHANRLAAFAAQNPNINPALIFQTHGGVIGTHNAAFQQSSFQPPQQTTFQQPTLQHPTLQQPMWPGQLTFQQVQQNHFHQLQQSMVQQLTLQNAVVQNRVLPQVPAIQNAAAVNPAVPSQVNSAPECSTISPLLTLLYTVHKAQAQACSQEAQEATEGRPLSFDGTPA
jgi:hypothetical protein